MDSTVGLSAQRWAWWCSHTFIKEKSQGRRILVQVYVTQGHPECSSHSRTHRTDRCALQQAASSSRLRAFSASLICCKNTHEACTGVLTLLPRQWLNVSLIWNQWLRPLLRSFSQKTTFQETINNLWTLLTSLRLIKLILKPYIYKQCYISCTIFLCDVIFKHFNRCTFITNIIGAWY